MISVSGFAAAGIDPEDPDHVEAAVARHRDIDGRSIRQLEAIGDVDVVDAALAGLGLERVDRLDRLAGEVEDANPAVLDGGEDEALCRVGRIDPEGRVVGVGVMVVVGEVAGLKHRRHRADRGFGSSDAARHGGDDGEKGNKSGETGVGAAHLTLQGRGDAPTARSRQ